MADIITVNPDDGLNIEISSGLNKDLKPFNTIFLNEKPAGQLSPDEVRAMALQWLEAAEAAEQDAMVVAEMTEGLGVDMQTAGAFVASLRKRRSKP